jgi:hypothetical protein
LRWFTLCHGHSGGRSYRRGGVTGDGDSDGELLVDAVVAQFEVERVVEGPLVTFWQPPYVDVALRQPIEYVGVRRGGGLFASC